MLHSAGVSVKATITDRITETEIVMANCLYNWPTMPPMNETGTNTAHSTRPMAITGPLTSSIAFSVACSGRQAMLDVVLHGFDHHDGVVHHDADREHDRQHGERIDRKAQSHERREGSHQGNRHRQHRNERRADVAQEDEHHDQHEDDGISQGEEDFVNGHLHELGGVQRNAVVEAGREVLLDSSSSFRTLSTV